MTPTATHCSHRPRSPDLFRAPACDGSDLTLDPGVPVRAHAASRCRHGRSIDRRKQSLRHRSFRLARRGTPRQSRGDRPHRPRGPQHDIGSTVSIVGSAIAARINSAIALPRHLIKRLQDVHALGEDQIDEQEPLTRSQQRRRTPGHVRRIAREMADEHVRVDKRGQRRRSARSLRVRRRTSSQGVPRLLGRHRHASGEREEVRRLRHQRPERSTRNTNSSPSCRSNASRTLAGIVTCPSKSSSLERPPSLLTCPQVRIPRIGSFATGIREPSPRSRPHRRASTARRSRTADGRAPALRPGRTRAPRMASGGRWNPAR